MNFLCTLFFLSLLALVIAAEIQELELWQNIPFKEEGTQNGHVSPNLSPRISNVHVPKLLYYVDEATRSQGKYAKKGLSVVLMPGGSYSLLSMVNEGSAVAEYLNGLGIAAYILMYRHRPYKHPVPVLDSMRAVRLVRKMEKERNDKNGLLSTSVGIMGFSAGGHLAASTLTFAGLDPSIYMNVKGAQDEGKPVFAGDDLASKYSARPDFSVLFYPVISMTLGITHDLSRENIAGSKPGTATYSELDKIMSLEKTVLLNRRNEPTRLRAGAGASGTTPIMGPVLIIHSGDDQVVPIQGALDFYAALNSMNTGVNQGTLSSDATEVDVELRVYSYGNHGYGTYETHRPRGGKKPRWNGAGGIFESWIEEKMSLVSSSSSSRSD